MVSHIKSDMAALHGHEVWAWGKKSCRWVGCSDGKGWQSHAAHTFILADPLKLRQKLQHGGKESPFSINLFFFFFNSRQPIKTIMNLNPNGQRAAGGKCPEVNLVQSPSPGSSRMSYFCRIKPLDLTNNVVKWHIQIKKEVCKLCPWAWAPQPGDPAFTMHNRLDYY